MRKKRTTYGQKGGTSANTGKKATTYVATAPDGTERRKRSFQPIRNPVMGFYEHKGQWYVACVTDKKNAFSHYTNKKATAV